MRIISIVLGAATAGCAAAALVLPALAQTGTTSVEQQAQEEKDGASVARPADTSQRTFVPGSFRIELDGPGGGLVSSVETKPPATPTLDSAAGSVRFGAFYRQKLYLLSSEKNRKDFLANPGAFEDTNKQK